MKRLSKASFISERRESGLVSRRGQVVARRAESKQQMSEIRDKRCTIPPLRDRTVIASVSPLITHALKYLRISSSQFLPRSLALSLSLFRGRVVRERYSKLSDTYLLLSRFGSADNESRRSPRSTRLPASLFSSLRVLVLVFAVIYADGERPNSGFE